VLVTGVVGGDGGGAQYSETKLFGQLITAPAIPTDSRPRRAIRKATLNWAAASGAAVTA